MGEEIMLRFDDLTREERYYSATILPYLLAYNDFLGLKFFEKALKSKNLISSLSTINNEIQIVSEIYPERDLPYYKIDIHESAFAQKIKPSKPDLLIISNESLYLIECKVFTVESEYELHQQILRQKYIIDIIEKTTQHQFVNKLHLLILPYEYEVDDCVVITWESIYSIFEEVIPNHDYFFQRLKSAIIRIKL